MITKTYTWAIHKIIVRPLEMVQLNNSQNGDSLPKLKSGNPMFSEKHKLEAVKQQQQKISKLDSLFTKVGIKFDRDALNRVWKLAGKSMADITQSIELLLHRHSTQAEAISNPQGWIIECLKKQWQKDFDLFYQPELPQFGSATAIANFVAGAVRSDTTNLDSISTA